MREDRRIGRASTGRENCTGWTEDVGQRASCCGDVSNIDKVDGALTTQNDTRDMEGGVLQAPMQLQVSVQVQDKLAYAWKLRRALFVPVLVSHIL